jgi:hypothetical protein
LVVWPIYQHIEYFSEPKGEFTVLVPPRDPADADDRAVPATDELRREFGELTDKTGVTRRQALKVLAERHGMAVNELYRILGRDVDDSQTT